MSAVDLKAGIEFEEVVIVTMRLIEVLHGPRALVADGHQQSLRSPGHGSKGGCGDEVGRAFLEDLLKPTLSRGTRVYMWHRV